MDLVVSATPREQAELRYSCPSEVLFLVSGVGLVETTYTLTSYLLNHPEVSRVLNVGIAGGFALSDIAVLDCCLATSETIGDLGICFDSHIDTLDSALITMGNIFPCKNRSYQQLSTWLDQAHHPFYAGPFLSVNSVSGSFHRGEMVNRNACICENMEGAAVARVCLGLNLDWLEFRVVSNLVENRNIANWQINPAIRKYSDMMAAFFQDIYP